MNDLFKEIKDSINEYLELSQMRRDQIVIVMRREKVNELLDLVINKVAFIDERKTQTIFGVEIKIDDRLDPEIKWIIKPKKTIADILEENCKHA